MAEQLKTKASLSELNDISKTYRKCLKGEVQESNIRANIAIYVERYGQEYVEKNFTDYEIVMTYLNSSKKERVDAYINNRD
jgi:hypothetical protein